MSFSGDNLHLDKNSNDSNDQKQNDEDSSPKSTNVIDDLQIIRQSSGLSIAIPHLPHISLAALFGAFWRNKYFIISVFVYILCLFMSFICILYGLGQIRELELTNYWCHKKDLETIYKHSWENNLNHGTNDGCWKSKQFTVSFT